MCWKLLFWWDLIYNFPRIVLSNSSFLSWHGNNSIFKRLIMSGLILLCRAFDCTKCSTIHDPTLLTFIARVIFYCAHFYLCFSIFFTRIFLCLLLIFDCFFFYRIHFTPLFFYVLKILFLDKKLMSFFLYNFIYLFSLLKFILSILFYFSLLFICLYFSLSDCGICFLHLL